MLLLNMSQAANPVDQSPPDREHIEQILNDLDSSSREIRLEALKKLDALSNREAPYLKLKLDAGTLSPSVSNSVISFLKQLESRQKELLVKPVRVKFANPSTLKNVIEKLIYETGNSIDFRSVSEKDLNSPCAVPGDQGMTFWETIDEIEKTAGVQLIANKSLTEYKLVPEDEVEKKPVLNSSLGLFRIAITSIRTEPLVQDSSRTKLRLNLRVYSEPRIYPLILFLKMQDIKLETDSGTAIQSYTPDSQLEISPVFEGKVMSFHMDFLLPKDFKTEGNHLHLEGRFPVMSASNREVFQIPLDEDPHEKNRHLLKLTLKQSEQFEKKEDTVNYRIALLADYDLVSDQFETLFESHRRWIFRNSPSLLHTESGTRILPVESANLMTQKANVMLYLAEFQDVSGNRSDLVLQFPAFTSFDSIPVEFDLRNLPFPESD